MKALHHAVFSNCERLSVVKLPDSLLEIGRRSFYSSTRLSSLIIPEKVSLIRTEAFLYSPINTLTVLNPVPPELEPDAIWNTDLDSVLVPAESVEAYKASQYWKDFNILPIGS